jgi:tetratricopeptide (TPR) repeat protein
LHNNYFHDKSSAQEVAMAYVRKRGNQVALVQGERDPETGKVGQRVLFTFYSKKEAVAALDDSQGRLLRDLLELEYPEIRFPWKRIWWGLARNLDFLPNDYEYRESEMVKRFRADLCAFTRQLVLNEPQWLFSSAELLRQHRYELEYLIELIQWRLKLCDTKPDEWNRDNEFYWRGRLRGREVPIDIEEEISDLYDRRDHNRTEAILRLLADSFESDAESHNYLGLIALDRGNPDEAVVHFTRMMELSRKNLPRRLTKSLFKNNHRGKPYRRGLSNLMITLNRLGRYDEALRLADQLEQVCGDRECAEYCRAGIHLNRGAWEQAVSAAHYIRNLWPETSFAAAMGSFEMGRMEESVADFVHGACNHPGAAPLIAGRRAKAPKTNDEARDWKVGDVFLQNLAGYLARNGPRVRRFFGALIANPNFIALMGEIEEVRCRRDEERRSSARVAGDLFQRMKSPKFATERATEICRSLRSGKAAGLKTHAR